jgi:hypothetical protein
MTMKNDPAIEAVRQARREISRELGNDPARLIAHYMERQAHFQGRIIQGPEDDGSSEDTAQLAAAADKRVQAR